LAKSIGNISPLTVCYRVGTSVNLLDPTTLKTSDLPTNIFWRSPFKSLADVQELIEFVVLDIEPLGTQNGRFFGAEATVARASDLGSNDKTYYCRTHLGGILHAGDSVLGYHLTGTNFNNPQFEDLEQSTTYSSTIPDVILVKKFYARKRKTKTRSWKLRRMEREEGELLPKKADQERMDADYEMFLRDVEEDEELRQTLALYKARQDKAKDEEMMSVAESSDEEVPQINVDELLDDFEDLNVHDDV
jgi:nonsense-mediated mRNA decay protein 3